MAQSILAQVSDISVQRGVNNVLERASASVSQGEIVAVIGENGSGKSTLIESFAGIIPLREGKVEWTHGSEKIVVRDSEGRRNPPPPMGLTLQNNAICGDETVSERLSVALSVSGIAIENQRISELLNCWGIGHRSSERISNLSGGLARRLAILCGLAPAVMSEIPRLVLLDEPSEGLDESSTKILRGWIKALSGRGHGILIATHDQEISSCADRIITIAKNSLQTSTGTSNGDPIDIPSSGSTSRRNPVASLVRWSFKTEIRNPVDSVGRATPAIVAILLSYALVGNIDLESHDSNLLAALVLAPGFIVSVSSPAIVSRLEESDSGLWWNAIVGPMARPAYSITAASIFLPIPVSYVSWMIMSTAIDSETSMEVLKWLWVPSLALLDLAIASTALHIMVADLSRSSAAPASLLLVVLVWPFLELTEALSFIIDNGMTFGMSIDDPIPTCLIASLISALVWLTAVIIPEY